MNCQSCQKQLTEKELKYSKDYCYKCQKEQAFDYNMIKGRIAEALIEQLFIKLNFKVYRYGMENTIPGIMELLRGVRSDVATTIKRMPDFVIQDKNNDAYFIEVKFRATEEFSIKDIPEDYPFENAFFIVVSKKHIKCLSYAQLKEGKEITPKCKNYLGSVKAFETDKDTIIDFCKYAVKFFKEV